jgi:hypothetical protein
MMRLYIYCPSAVVYQLHQLHQVYLLVHRVLHLLFLHLHLLLHLLHPSAAAAHLICHHGSSSSSTRWLSSSLVPVATASHLPFGQPGMCRSAVVF